MRELVKSAVGSMVALSLLGAREMLRPFVPQRELEATIDATREAADTLQRGLVDLVFSVGNV